MKIFKDTKKLEELLTNLAKPVLNDSSVVDLKNRVFARIKQPELVCAIKKVVAGFSLDLTKKAEIKERIFELLDSHRQRSFVWQRLFVFSYKALSAVLVVAIGFGSFVMMKSNEFVVRASSFTALDNVEGNVAVKRGNILFPAREGLVLKERDILLTLEDSFAVVKFFDDSVTRLSENTKLNIEKLDGQVELSLDHGTLWSNVINLSQGEAVFAVRASHFTARTEKAAFNLAFNEGQIDIGVFSDAVEVVSGENVDKVLSGEKVLTQSDLKVISKVEISESDKKQEWVQKNLESDRQYLSEVETRLVAAKLQAIGVDAPEEISFEKSLTENVALFLTFDEIDKKKMQLDLAERNFLAAQLKLQQREVTEEEKAEAGRAIDDFANKTKDFYGLLAEVKRNDEDYAKELRSYLDTKVLAQKKDLSLVLPDSPVYGAREVVRDLELLTADDKEELLQIKENQAAEKAVAMQKAGIVPEVVVKPVEPVKVITEVVPEVVDEIVPEVVPEVVPEQPSKEVVIEAIIEGPYGVKIKDDKPLDPLLSP